MLNNQKQQPNMQASLQASLLHVLRIRFTDQSEPQDIQGNQAELHALLADLQWAHGCNNMLQTSVYFKRSGLSLFDVPSAPCRIAEYSIFPLDGIKPQAKTHYSWKQTRKLYTKITKSIKFAAHSQEHEQCYINLCGQTTVTCTETGISFNVSLPAPVGLNLAYVHPFSFPQNVQDTLTAFNKQGVRIESQLERQVIAGMLLTVLRQKKLLICTDFVSANLCLQHAKHETLGFALRFFSSLPSALHLPQIHLVPEALYDFYHAPRALSEQQVIADRVEILIQNYIKVCRGEGITDNRATSIIKKPSTKRRIRVHGGNAAIELRQVNARESIANKLLDTLVAENNLTTASREMLENKIDALMFMGEDKRKATAIEILHMFPNNKTAKELATLFNTTKTSTMEIGLLSFSQELENEIKEHQGKRKFNLLSNVTKA